jgi:hypothetical protein
MDQSFNPEKRASTFPPTPQIVALKDQLSRDGCAVHESGSREYAQATRLWNGAVERKLALVIVCCNANDVRAACGRRGQLEFLCQCAMAVRIGLAVRCETADSFLT